MSEKYDKWAMFRNYMYNELGITKEDIRGWIKEAAEEEAKKLVNNTYDDFNVRDTIQTAADRTTSRYFKEIKSDVVDKLVSKILLNIQANNQEETK